MQQDRNTDPHPPDPPLTARSVVASTLLGMDPPESSARLLVRSAELFGIAEGTTRTAVSRMVSAGELEATGDGRYRLSGPLLTRQRRQLESRRPAPARWDGTWHQAVVTAGGRSASDRAALRAAMTAARMAELRDGCWMRPANLAVAPPGAIAAQCQWFAATPVDGTEGSRLLAASLWDLAGWSSRAEALLERMAATAGDLEAGDVSALAACFTLAASVLRHLQADPLLPHRLLPESWPGGRLRDAYERYERSLQAVLRAWYRTNREA